MTLATMKLAPIDESSPTARKIGYALGPLFFLMTFLLGAPEGMTTNAWHVCGLALWMATWWITEAMPLPVTSLLPIIILPVFSIQPLKETTAPFASSIIFLFLGGFMLSVAMEKWNLHMRIGLGILKLVGIGPKSILAGLMVATAFMGMWISNTATAIMMLPMAVSIALLLSEQSDNPDNKNLVKATVLGVAYAPVIGGLSTFVGTPTNAILNGHMSKQYGFSFSLAEWMEFGVPLSITLLAITWAVLTFFYLRKADVPSNVREVVREAYANLGRMDREEKGVLAIFVLVAGLWCTSSIVEKALGIQLEDAVIGILGAVLLFLIPMDKTFERTILTWKDTTKLPWGILIFFGGSLCMSETLTNTGVTSWLSVQLQALSGINIVLMVMILVVLLIAVSELMSNVATITAFLPILSAMAAAMNINPLLILVPATLAASCGFMLPGASAPNALAFGTGYVKVKDMIRTGVLLDIVSMILVTLFTFTLISWSFDISLSEVPEWAAHK